MIHQAESECFAREIIRKIFTRRGVLHLVDFLCHQFYELNRVGGEEHLLQQIIVYAPITDRLQADGRIFLTFMSYTGKFKIIRIFKRSNRMTRSEILEILKRYKKENSEKYGINTLGIFGSLAKNEEKSDSDIDIVIETNEPDLFKLVHIKDELEKPFGKKVDIVRNRNTMNPYLKKHIKKDAVYV